MKQPLKQPSNHGDYSGIMVDLCPIWRFGWDGMMRSSDRLNGNNGENRRRRAGHHGFGWIIAPYSTPPQVPGGSAYRQIHIAEAKPGCELTAQGGKYPNINLGASSEAEIS